MLTVSGIAQLSAIAVLRYLTSLVPSGLVGTVYVFLLVGYYFQVVRSASRGSTDLPEPEDVLGIESIVGPVSRFSAATLALWLPGALYIAATTGLDFLWVGGAAPPAVIDDPVLLGLAVAGALYCPAAIISASLSGSTLAALNPMMPLSIIRALPGTYFLTAAGWVVLCLLDQTRGRAVDRVLDAVTLPVLPALLGEVSALVLPLASAFFLGRFIFEHAERFGFERPAQPERPEWPEAEPRGMRASTADRLAEKTRAIELGPEEPPFSLEVAEGEASSPTSWLLDRPSVTREEQFELQLEAGRPSPENRLPDVLPDHLLRPLDTDSTSDELLVSRVRNSHNDSRPLFAHFGRAASLSSVKYPDNVPPRAADLDENRLEPYRANCGLGTRAPASLDGSMGASLYEALTADLEDPLLGAAPPAPKGVGAHHRSANAGALGNEGPVQRVLMGRPDPSGAETRDLPHPGPGRLRVDARVPPPFSTTRPGAIGWSPKSEGAAVGPLSSTQPGVSAEPGPSFSAPDRAASGDPGPDPSLRAPSSYPSAPASVSPAPAPFSSSAASVPLASAPDDRAAAPVGETVSVPGSVPGSGRTTPVSSSVERAPPRSAEHVKLEERLGALLRRGHDAAVVATYDACLRAGGPPALAPVLALRLAGALERAGRLKDALATYRRTHEVDPLGDFAPRALFQAARLLETGFRRPDHAATLYDRLMTEFATHDLAHHAREARRRLPLLGPRAHLDG